MLPRSLAPLLLVSTLAASAQSEKDNARVIWADTTLADSVRFTTYYHYIWDEVMFSAPDSAYIMANELRQAAHRSAATSNEGNATGLMATALYVKGEAREALGMYARALQLHQQAKDLKGMADAITNMGAMQYYLGAHTEAIDLYEKGLRMHIQLKDSASIANDLNAMGGIQMARGDHARAMEHYNKSLRIQEALGNERGLATGYANLGALSLSQNDAKGALPRYKEVVRIGEELNDRHLVGKGLEKVGLCLLGMGDSTEALHYFRRSLATREAIPDQHGIVSASNAIGELLLAQGKVQQALVCFERSIAIASREELSYGWAVALAGAGNAHLRMGHHLEALDLAMKAGDLAVEAEEVAVERDAVELRYKALKALGRPHEALAMHERFMALRDSVTNDEAQREVLRNEYAYAYENQALLDSVAHAAAVQHQTLAHERGLASERSRTYTVLGIAGVLLLLLAFIWSRARLLKRTNAAITAAQQQVVESEKQREALEVRTRIALDVHDDLGSDLTRIGMLGTELQRHVAQGSSRVTDVAQELGRLTRQAGNALTDIIWAVDPARDTARMLVSHAREHAERTLADSGITASLDFDHNGPDRTLDPAAKRDIFLVMKEAINNAVKYAGADHLEVALRTGEAAFDLRVSDNGKGFDTAQDSDGNGLGNLRTRARRLNAQLRIDSAMGSGTIVHLAGPLH